tara:strand:+ start:5974 stop:6447 length:474 start_codon:yes stop_codon:yes gene_type:complete
VSALHPEGSSYVYGTPKKQNKQNKIKIKLYNNTMETIKSWITPVGVCVLVVLGAVMVFDGNSNRACCADKAKVEAPEKKKKMRRGARAEKVKRMRVARAEKGDRNRGDRRGRSVRGGMRGARDQGGMRGGWDQERMKKFRDAMQKRGEEMKKKREKK